MVHEIFGIEICPNRNKKPRDRQSTKESETEETTETPDWNKSTSKYIGKEAKIHKERKIPDIFGQSEWQLAASAGSKHENLV